MQLWKAGFAVSGRLNPAHVHIIAEDLISAAQKAGQWAGEIYVADYPQPILISVELVDVTFIE
jgi:hypothetical protein